MLTSAYPQLHYDARVGTSRASIDDLDSPALRLHREHRATRAMRLRSKSMSTANTATVQLDFEPMTVAFRDLHYTYAAHSVYELQQAVCSRACWLGPRSSAVSV